MADEAGEGGGGGRREVVVPLELYKVVVVFSTLIAIACIVAGFVALDVATRRATAPPSQVDPVLAVGGLAAIAAGAAVYAFGSRFLAPGMRTTKPDDDEGDADG